MAHLSVTTMPASVEMVERAHRGKTAQVVLTGEGGGDWMIPLGFSPTGAAASESPDVVLTADVVGWWRVASEGMAPEALPREVVGDEALADDLVAASSAFATVQPPFSTPAPPPMGPKPALCARFPTQRSNAP
jgi:hypothetical protein